MNRKFVVLMASIAMLAGSIADKSAFAQDATPSLVPASNVAQQPDRDQDKLKSQDNDQRHHKKPGKDQHTHEKHPQGQPHKQQRDQNRNPNKHDNNQLGNQILKASPLVNQILKASPLEIHSTLEFSRYLDLHTPSKIIDLTQAQQILKHVTDITGVKPALLYISFVPQTDSQATQSSEEPQTTTPNQDVLELKLVTSSGSPLTLDFPKSDRTQLLALAHQFRNQVADPSQIRTRSYLKSAEQLYQLLIAPIEPALKAQGIGNIAFILDGGLRFIPVAALYDGHQFLIEKYSLGILPSLSLTDTHITNLAHAKLLAGGATQFADQSPLPAVPLELEAIHRNWPGVSLMDHQFTLAELNEKRQQEPFSLIHLATHAEFLPGDIKNSYIQLADTRLHLNQLNELHLNNPPADLLVLSACRTALGDKTAELGFAGLAVKAGVKSALASLWNVSDEGTSGLMAEFYQKLRRSPIKAEALRQAQIAMLKGEVRLQGGNLIWPGGQAPLPPALQDLGNLTLSHPYYWAAFTLIGNPW